VASPNNYINPMPISWQTRDLSSKGSASQQSINDSSLLEESKPSPAASSSTRSPAFDVHSFLFVSGWMGLLKPKTTFVPMESKFVVLMCKSLSMECLCLHVQQLLSIQVFVDGVLVPACPATAEHSLL
jgi:hypothetical protein